MLAIINDITEFIRLTRNSGVTCSNKYDLTTSMISSSKDLFFIINYFPISLTSSLCVHINDCIVNRKSCARRSSISVKDSNSFISAT